MFFATIFFMVVKIGVKMLPHIPPMEIVFFRCIISFFITFFLLRRKRISIFGNNRFLLILRGLCGTAGLYLYFIILQNIPLATASTLIYLTPLFTSIVGVLVLKEKMSFFQWFLLFVAFSGILLIQGFDSRVTIESVIIGASGSLLKNNIKEFWWKSMVQLNDNIVGLDSAIFMHSNTWQASGNHSNEWRKTYIIAIAWPIVPIFSASSSRC